jgi:hypothetical protein
MGEVSPRMKSGATEGVFALWVKMRPPEALSENSAGLTPSVIALSRADSSPIEGERARTHRFIQIGLCDSV